MNRNFIFLSIAISFVVSSCVKKNDNYKNSEIIVESLEPKKIIYQEKIVLNGIVLPKKQYKLSFKIGGAIDRIYKNVGENVKKGQLLASLKQNEIEAAVKQAESALEKARRDFQRVEKLYKDSVATLENYQDAATALQAAEANFEIAKFNLSLSKIFSPVDGKVLLKIMEENEIVGPGMPILVIASDEENWTLKVSASDKDKIKIFLNDKALIKLDAFGSEEFEGFVSSISKMADLKTGLFDIEIDFAKSPKKISAGFIGSAVVYTQNKFEAYSTSIDALAEASNRKGIIYDISNGFAKEIEIDIIDIEKDKIIFNCDSVPKKIAGKGSAYLKSGTKVKESSNFIEN